MDKKSFWRCPECKSEVTSSKNELSCIFCESSFEIANYVFDFVPRSPIAESFGYQWNKFPQVQLDSVNGDTRSRDRFLTETGWEKENLDGKLVLDAGCGSGRFSEIALSLASRLVAVDASEAISAAQKNLQNFKEATLVRANLLNLPFKNGVFDYVYCIGVLQHTSDPFGCIEELGRVTKSGGHIALTFYERSGWWTILYSKYLVRRLTRRIPKKILLRIISKSSMLWFSLTSLLFGLPGIIGQVFRFAIPVANYVEYSYTKKELRKLEAILDTFDMLSPEFDSPLNKLEVIEKLESLGFRITCSSQKGNVQAKKL